MIQTILWDVDGTLLDFLAAEEAAIRKLFVEFDMGECSDEMLTRYSKINRSYWERLERNEITKQQVLVGRFKEWMSANTCMTRSAAMTKVNTVVVMRSRTIASGVNCLRRKME